MPQFVEKHGISYPRVMNEYSRSVGESKMSEAYRIALTSMATVLILVCGQVLIRSFIDPFYKLRNAIGEIGYTLLYYKNVLTNPGTMPQEEERKVARLLRQKACLLKTREHGLLWYRLFQVLHVVPPRKEIDEAVKQLVGLSNSVGHHGMENQILKRIEKIGSALKLTLLIDPPGG